MPRKRSKPRKPKGPKRIGVGDIKGDQGIAFIHSVVSTMGFLWKPHGAPEAGIDGHIELRDDLTGEVHNAYTLVQSKAGPSYFKAETENTFDFACEEEDLKYWLSGSIPVILVVSRNGNEGYWISLKEYFRDPQVLASRRITFDKQTQGFNLSARSRIIEVCEPKDAGLYISPIPKRENLFSNVLPLSFKQGDVYTATTPIKSQAEFDRRISDRSMRFDWAVYDGEVTSFTDLTLPQFRGLIDDGSVERVDLQSFADRELQGRFIHLLNSELREYLVQFDITFHEWKELYYFESLRYKSERKFHYQSIKEKTSRDVVIWRTSKEFGTYCRHTSAEIAFKCYDDKWYAEVVPTYLFTRDGTDSYRWAPSLLRGIKKLENNKAVVGQTLMWIELLSVEQGLFEDRNRPFVFERELRFEVPCGLNDGEWLPPPEEAVSEEGGLFG